MAKLVIKDVKYGKVPYGPGAGSSSLAVYIDEADGDYDYPTPAPNPKDPKHVYTPAEIAGHGLMGDLLKAVEAQNLGEVWTKVLLVQDYIYFVGDCLAAPEHRDVSIELLTAFDACGLAVQVELLKKKFPDEQQRKSVIMKNGIQSPLTMYITSPKYYTASSKFYENFRFIMVKYLLGDAKVNPMALVELGNHRFSTGIFEINDFEADTKSIADKYESLDALTIPGDRTFVVDYANDVKALDYAIERGYRINIPLPYKSDSVLKF